MERIVFAWELGGGLGHIQRILPIARKLKEKNHEVICVMKDFINADKIMGEYGIKVMQAPVWHEKVKNRIENTFSYADTLYNHGYLIKGRLQSMVSAWRCLFESIDPDFLIADHAPTALIAARGAELKVALCGTGFCNPPLRNPIPSIISWIKAPEGIIEKSEARVVQVINAVLKKNAAPELKSLCDLFDVDENFLVTFKELDHFQDREKTKYWGPVISLPEGVSPEWPATRFPKKIFCYIKPTYPHLQELLSSLQQVNAATIVFMPNAPKKIIEDFSAANLKFTTHPLNMKEACRACDLVICHAGHGTVAVSLLHGKPMVLLPGHNQLEQIITARHVFMAKLAEVVLTRHPQRDYKGAIEKVLSEFRFTKQAKVFAKKYKNFDSVKLVGKIADRCEEIMYDRE
jgi:UDP:flavonoid glycosyltransferase YjiC (YdhE family)